MGEGEVVHITWGEAAKQVRRVAAYLMAQGVKHGDRVAILSKIAPTGSW